MERLIDLGDKAAREAVGDYYIISKSRMDNLLSCFSSGAARIKALAEIVTSQQEEIAKLSEKLLEANDE